MPSGRNTPALFELINSPKGAGGPGSPTPSPSKPGAPTPTSTPGPTAAGRLGETQARPMPPAGRPDSAQPTRVAPFVTESKPGAAPQAAEPAARPARAETAAPAKPTDPISPAEAVRGELDRRFTFSMSHLYIAAAALVVLVAVIWGVAYRVGRSQEKAKADEQLGLVAPPQLSDPLKSGGIPANPGLIVPRPETPAGGATRAGQATGQLGSQPGGQPGTRAAGNAAAANPNGPLPEFGVDPRTPGLNYLLVEGQLDQATAEKMMAFLRGKGLPAFAVVDDRSGAANNPPLYLVGIDRGITGSDFRAKVPARTDLESRIRALGTQWQTEHRGSTDFSRTSWERKR